MTESTSLTIRISEDLRAALDHACGELADDPRMKPPGSLGKLTRSDVARRALVIGVRHLMASHVDDEAIAPNAEGAPT